MANAVEVAVVAPTANVSVAPLDRVSTSAVVCGAWSMVAERVAVPAPSSTVRSASATVVTSAPSTMVPVPLVPPMVRVRVSLASMAASSVVGMVTLKLDIPVATVIVPSPLSVTPAPNVGAP